MLSQEERTFSGIEIRCCGPPVAIGSWLALYDNGKQCARLPVEFGMIGLSRHHATSGSAQILAGGGGGIGVGDDDISLRLPPSMLPWPPGKAEGRPEKVEGGGTGPIMFAPPDEIPLPLIPPPYA